MNKIVDSKSMMIHIKKMDLVIYNEEHVCGRVKVTRDEERGLNTCKMYKTTQRVECIKNLLRE